MATRGIGRWWLIGAMVCASTTGMGARRPETVPAPPQSVNSAGGAVFVPAANIRVLLALDRLQETRWYPTTFEGEANIAADREMVRQALASSNAELRRIAVRGVGRFESPADVVTLAPFLGDADPAVRREAANAIAMAVNQQTDSGVLPALAALRAAPQFAPVAGIGDAQAALNAVADASRFEAMARLHYDHETAQKVLETLDPHSPGNILLMLRRDGELRVTPNQRITLRGLAKPVRPDVRANRDALEVVFMMGDVDPLWTAWAAQYQCPSFPRHGPECGWEIRYLGVSNLLPLDAFLGPVLGNANRDPTPEVRIMALRKQAGVIVETKSCAPMIDALDDPTEFSIVRLEAIDLMDSRCMEREDISRRLETWIADPALKDRWSFSARAIERLAVIDPAKAAKLVADVGSRHDLWPLRAASARAAFTLRDTEVLRRLANDDNPNVQTVALSALFALRDSSVTPLARRALSSPDDQLVAAAAGMLRDATDRQGALVDLWAAMKRLTESGRDTSRTSRLAILACLKAWAPPVDNVTVVRSYVDALKGQLTDFDPLIASAAADVVAAVTGERPAPRPTHRPGDQPTEDELRRLPATAAIKLQNGVTVTIKLLSAEAPLAVARFARLARARYFDNQMLIYQLNILRTASGGSPGANDFSGDKRFERDEIGIERHTTGAVGLFTHGRDTGDGRFFIDLFPQPGFDGEYTVFGRVDPPAMVPDDPVHPFPQLTVTNRLLEGGTILTVLLDPPRR